MSKASVIIEKWKLPIFSRHLGKAGYSYETCPGLTDNTHTLIVNYVWVAKLKSVIEAAQKEAAASNPQDNQGEKPA